MGMYVQYGSYQHPTGEATVVAFEAHINRSPRGAKQSTIYTTHVQGDFCLGLGGSTEYDIDAKVADLWAALSIDGQDFGLYHSNGTPTSIYFPASDALSMTGNQVTKFFMPGGNGEWASGKAFSYSVTNERLTPNSIVIDYQDSLVTTGDGGPVVEWKLNRYLPAHYIVEAQSSFCHVIHSGSARTLATWMLPPDPYFSAPFHLGHMKRIARLSPVRHPNGFSIYTVSWQYHYILPLSDGSGLVPTAR